MEALPLEVDLQGQCAFILHEARCDCGLLEQWRMAIAREGLREVRESTVASVFVVVIPAAPGDRNMAIASMVGGCLCTPGFCLEPRGSGAFAAQFARVLLMPRYITVSERCARQAESHVGLLEKGVRRGSAPGQAPGPLAVVPRHPRGAQALPRAGGSYAQRPMQARW